MDEVRRHFEKYIVIQITFAGAPTDLTSAITCLEMAITESYHQQNYLRNSKELSSERKSHCNYWCNPKKDLAETLDTIGNGLIG